MAINIANQRGSISNKALTGKRIGTNIKQISMKSRKNPKTNIISILVIKKVIFPESVAKISRIKKSPPIVLNTNEKAVAPIRIAKTMLLNFEASIAASNRVFKFRQRFPKANTIAPKQPIAALSVGEAIPVIIAPKTNVMRITAGIVEMIISFFEIS